MPFINGWSAENRSILIRIFAENAIGILRKVWLESVHGLHLAST
jgi:hypothetical protein